MKILIRIFATTTVSLIFSNTYANIFKQKMEALSHQQSEAAPCGYLKLPVVVLAQDDSLNIFRENYPAVYKKLIKKFKNVETLRYSVGNKVVYLSFTNNGHKVDACYSLTGFIRYSISYVGTALPEEVIKKIKTEYPAYTIFYGKDIRINGEIIYQVIIESSYGYRRINLRYDEMEEQENLKKI